MSRNNLTALEQKGFAHLILVLIVLVVLVVIGVVIVSLGLIKLPSLQKPTSTQTLKSQPPAVDLREAYQNPFDSGYKNPFDNLE